MSRVDFDIIEALTYALGRNVSADEIKKKYPFFASPPYSYLLQNKNSIVFFEKESVRSVGKIIISLVERKDIKKYYSEIIRAKKLGLDLLERVAELFRLKESNSITEEFFNKKLEIFELDIFCCKNSLVNISLPFCKLDIKDYADKKTVFIHHSKARAFYGEKAKKSPLFFTKAPKMKIFKSFTKNLFVFNNKDFYCATRVLRKKQGSGRAKEDEKIFLSLRGSLFRIFQALDEMKSPILDSNVKKILSYFYPNYHIINKEGGKDRLFFGFVPFDIDTLHKQEIYSVQDYCEFIFGRIPYKLNKLSPSVAFSFSCFLECVKERDRDAFYLFCRDKFNIKSFKRNHNIERLGLYRIKNPLTQRGRRNIRAPINLAYYFLLEQLNDDLNKRLESVDDKHHKERIIADTKRTIQDTIRMYFSINEEMPIKIKSLNKLKNLHDKVVHKYNEAQKRKISNKPLEIQEKYKRLRVKGFRLIKRERELYSEGLEQRHCVYSYQDKIERNECLIYTGTMDDQKWTIEVNIKNNAFSIAQVSGKYNNSPSSKTLEKIAEAFKGAKNRISH